jgi:hypothetical protein
MIQPAISEIEQYLINISEQKWVLTGDGDCDVSLTPAQYRELIQKTYSLNPMAYNRLPTVGILETLFGTVTIHVNTLNHKTTKKISSSKPLSRLLRGKFVKNQDNIDWES